MSEEYTANNMLVKIADAVFNMRPLNYKQGASFEAPFSLSKKSNLPAKRAFVIRFLLRVSRGKKHFYPHKCAVCRQRRQTVRAGRMFGGKVTLVTFSTV